VVANKLQPPRKRPRYAVIVLLCMRDLSRPHPLPKQIGHPCKNGKKSLPESS